MVRGVPRRVTQSRGLHIPIHLLLNEPSHLSGLKHPHSYQLSPKKELYPLQNASKSIQKRPLANKVHMLRTRELFPWYGPWYGKKLYISYSYL